MVGSWAMIGQDRTKVASIGSARCRGNHCPHWLASTWAALAESSGSNARTVYSGHEREILIALRAGTVNGS